MRALIRLGIAGAVIAVAAALLAGGASAAGSGAATIAKAKCDISGDLGPSYVTSLKVRNTSCKKGDKVVIAFHNCRKDNGGSDGRCNQVVLGFSCQEGKREQAPAQYNAKVKCKKGDKKVVHTYTQNT